MFGFGVNNEVPVCGGRHESVMEGCPKEIKSKEIVSFFYAKDGDYCVSAKKKNGKVHITCNGGGKYNRRDGSLFGIKLEIDDDSVFKKIQEIIDKNNDIAENGRCTHVDGLPGGIGGSIDVVYESGEKLYKISNQSPVVSDESTKEYYDLFHELVKKEGLDFTTEGSNVKLFDDATEEYVQGTWKGTHFGREVEATFTDNKVSIKVDGEYTDKDIEYVIFQGTVSPNKLKEGKTEATDYHDYEYFEGVSCFMKKNYFTMTAYFMKESYSTCDMHNFDKKKPENE